MSVTAAPPDAAALDGLRFRAETNPLGPAVDLVWELPAESGPDGVDIRVLRRERRYPGRSRRGWVPVAATAADLTDGTLVLDITATTPLAFDVEETRTEREAGGLLVTTTRQYRYRGTPRDRELVRVVRRAVADGRPPPTVVRVADRKDVVAGTIYYYTAFVGGSSAYSRTTQASALATGRHPAGLFAALPRVDQDRDRTAPAAFTVAREDEGKGQLQRYLETAESQLDMVRGFVAGLRDLRNVRRVDARLLPQLAQLLGWRLKDYLDEDAQRVEVMFATEFYRTVGTSANIAAMVNRLTGWDARVREFVRNVLVSYDGSRREHLDGPVVGYLDGSMAVHPAPPPPLRYRTVPPGSVDTADTAAMFGLRNRLYDDATGYSYDCGRPTAGGYVRDDTTWYSRDTIGIYIVPDVDTEVFVLQAEWERVRQILREFLPINVRAVFVLMPGVVVEEEYDATQQVTEQSTDTGVLQEVEVYGEGDDFGLDKIAGWRHLITNTLADRSVSVAVAPVDTGARSWHTGLS